MRNRLQPMRTAPGWRLRGPAGTLRASISLDDMSLQIIGAGFGRTGTASLRAALVILGFSPCYHMFEIRDRPWLAAAWLSVMDSHTPDWKSLFEGYPATVDWPGAAFYEELLAAHPQAKVILTTRPAKDWYRSAHDTIYGIYRSFPCWLSWPGSPARSMIALLERVIWAGTFQHRFHDEELATAVFMRHNARVQQIVPAQQLLVFEVKDGWEPLCRFLEVPVPAQPFPHVNERQVLQRFGLAVRLITFVVNVVVFPLGLADVYTRWKRTASTG